VQPVTGELDTLLTDLALEYLILDVDSDPNWLEMLLVVRRSRPTIRQLVLGPAGNEELVIRSIMAGARAYLDNNAGTLAVRQAVDMVMSGNIWAPRRLLSRLVDRMLNQPASHGPTPFPSLSRRESQVLELIMGACSNREIARKLGIEERTVKAYVGSLLRKTGADNRVTLSVLATQGSLREGWMRVQ
jgi:DNA-binding NarL/FixJ family response regulator